MWYISLALCLVILSIWIIQRKRKLGVFQKLGIPGPPPSLLFGNFCELYYKGQHECISKWIKEHGRVFGYYYGIRPILVVADVELLRSIQVKDFQKFSTRPSLCAVGSECKSINSCSLATAQGKRWKELRSIITPTFTVLKLKKMSQMVNNIVDELIEAVEKESSGGKSFNIYHLYQNLTMDVIARTTLGIHTNALSDENEPFVKLARIIFSLKMNFMTMLTFSLPELMPMFSLIKHLKPNSKEEDNFPRQQLYEKTAAAIKMRRSNPDCRRPDVLQLMIDAQRIEGAQNDKHLTAGGNENFSEQDTSSQNASKGNGKGMSDEEILQNCTLFLLAGFETTSTALAFMTHCLIHHQDIQDKAREEINRYVSHDEELTYEVVHKLQYLDNIMNEALRLYPPITYFINRRATEDFVTNTIRIPKDTFIQVPVYYLHHDPTLWEEPETFSPERFSPAKKANNHPMAFQPFGAGPRNCIGLRFAQMEVKMAIAKLIKKYKLMPKRGAKMEDFEICCSIITMRPEKGVHVEVEPI